MSFLTDSDINKIKIKRMVFHVINIEHDEPIFLEEITPLQFVDFFIERIKSALKGNLFLFNDQSQTEKHIREIKNDPKKFLENSKLLARNFKSRHTGATSNGAFFIFEIENEIQELMYALIKYDNEEVVKYTLPTSEISAPPLLERFHEAFVRNAQAMQKIAIIKLDEPNGGQILVKDRSNIAHISKYFEGFLEVKRKFNQSDLTNRLYRALDDTFKEHKNDLPDENKLKGRNRIAETLRNNKSFDIDDCDKILNPIFGNTSQDSQIRKTLIKKLKKERIQDEVFDLDKDAIPKASRIRIKTNEGTEITYNIENKPEIFEENGKTKIVVTTTKIEENHEIIRKDK